MKIARLYKSGKETFGLVKDNFLATREQITYDTGIPLPLSIKDFLFDGWYDELKKDFSKISFKDELAGSKILAPIPNPPKIICMAFNYIDHAKEQDVHPPKDPVIVMKPRTALTGDNSDIICPSFVSKLDYEIELALIIGKNCKDISESEAMDAIFGYSI